MTRPGATATIIVIIAVIILAMLAYRSANAASPVSAFERAFGLFPGRLIVVPQLNGTVEYLRTETRPHGEYAVVFKRKD